MSDAPFSRAFGVLIIAILALAAWGIQAARNAEKTEKALAARSLELIHLGGALRDAQVASRTQVQEWKNRLLRGHDPAEAARYEAQFRDASAEFEAALGRLSGMDILTPGQKEEIARILDEHLRLNEVYAEAIQAFEPGTRESTFAVDQSVQGVDRALNGMIGAFADEIGAHQKSVFARAQETAEAEFERMKLVTSILSAIVLAILGVLVWMLFRRGVK